MYVLEIFCNEETDTSRMSQVILLTHVAKNVVANLLQSFVFVLGDRFMNRHWGQRCFSLHGDSASVESHCKNWVLALLQPYVAGENPNTTKIFYIKS